MGLFGIPLGRWATAALLASFLALLPAAAQTQQAAEEPGIADLFVDGDARGPVNFSLSRNGSLLLDAATVREALTGIVRPELVELVAGGTRVVSTNDLALIGVSAKYDAAGLAITMDVEPRALIPRDLAGQEGRLSASGGRTLSPEPFAAQLGLTFNINPEYAKTADTTLFSPRADLGMEPAFYLLGFVAEGNIDLSYYDGFSPRVDEARLVRDLPAIGARLEAGIVDTQAVSFQTAAPLYGLAFFRETSLPGGKTAMKSTLTELLIEAKATVTIEVNGTVVRHLRLAPGSYRLSDLSLSSGLNEVVVRIEEEGREPRVIRFGLPFDAAMLDRGEIDYGLALGFDRKRPEQPLGAAHVAVGFSPTFGAGVDLEAGLGSLLEGLSVQWATPIGNLAASGGVSLPLGGPALQPGFASRFSWRLTLPWARFAPRLGLAAEYRGPGFAPPREDPAIETPTLATWTLAGQIGESLPGNAGSLHLLVDSTLVGDRLERLSVQGGLTLSITRFTSLSFTGGGLWNETGGMKPSAAIALSVFSGGRPSLHYRHDAIASSDSVDLTFALDPDNTTTLDIHGDGIVGRGVDSSSGISARTAAGAFDLAASLDQSRIVASELQLYEADFSASTTLAFAKKHLVAARAIGDSFAILVPAKTLALDKVELRPLGGQAVASEGGEAVLVPGIMPYIRYSATVELPESSPDRRAEPASVELSPTYRSGTIIEVRTTVSVAARGRLVDAKGRAVANLMGDRIEADGSILPFTGTFTDEDGVFECYELKPGPQIIRWSDGRTSRFTVAEGEGDGGAVAELGEVLARDKTGGE